MIKVWKLELLRILRTRSTLLFLITAVALSVLMAYVPVTYVQFSCEENGQRITLKGREALAMRKSLRNATDGEVTPEKMADGLAAYQRNAVRYGSLGNSDIPVNVYNTELFPYGEAARGHGRRGYRRSA